MVNKSINRILLLIEHTSNRRILVQSLAEQYQILAPEEANFVEASKEFLQQDFDLCLIDYGAVNHLRELMLARREISVPTYLPFVFLTTIAEVGLSTDHLESLIDDVIHLPVKKIELQTKIRVLLRSRSYSLQLKAAKEELNETLIETKGSSLINSRFVSTLSHEIRNPLNNISGMAQILEAYGDRLDTEKKTEIIQQLRRNVDKMTVMLDNILEISRQNAGKLQFAPTPLNLKVFCQDLVDDVQNIFDSKQAINLVYRGKEEHQLDRKLLQHILNNLLINACKYSTRNSTIDFEIDVRVAEIVFNIGESRHWYSPSRYSQFIRFLLPC